MGVDPGDDADAPDTLDANALCNFLRLRPPIELLVQHNIIRDVQADVLRHAEAATELGRRLRTRPTAEELLDKNVLKASDSSPAIAAISASVSKQQHRDHLARSLRRKPALDELVRRNIYHSLPDPGERAAAGGSMSRGASLQLQVSILNELMQRRPPLDDLLRAELSKCELCHAQLTLLHETLPCLQLCRCYDVDTDATHQWRPSTSA